MVTNTSPLPQDDGSEPYFNAAERWFEGIGATAQARALIEGKLDEPALWRSFEGFGLAELLAEETDLVERARLMAGVGRAAGRHLHVGPLAEAALGHTLAHDMAPSSSPSMLATLSRQGPAAPVHVALPFAAMSAEALVMCRGDVLRLPVDPTSVRQQADGTSAAWFPAPIGLDTSDAGDPASGAHESTDLLILCTAARLVGVGQQALALATGHLLLRQQFKRPLAAFQALQHASADRHADVDLASALLAQVVAHWAEPGLRRTTLPALKAFASGQAVRAAEHAVQMMGAMGFTHEADAGLFLRHAMTLAARHGDAASQRAAFSAQAIDFFADPSRGPLAGSTHDGQPPADAPAPGSG